MSVYFVYRSHSDNPGAFHVKVFPQDTVLEWFQSIWVGIQGSERAPIPSRDHAFSLIGRHVYSFSSLFESIHEHGWATPKSMTTAAKHFEEALFTEEMKYGSHHLQLLAHDELEVAIYIFDDEYAAKNPHRAAFLMREDWRMPDGASEAEFKPKGVPKTAKLVRGAGVTYFAHFAAYDTGSLTDLPDFGLCGAVVGVRVADFPRYLFAMRNRLADNPDDETLNAELRQLVTGLNALIHKAKGDEKAFFAALSANPDDYAGWCAYSDWRMERDRPPLLSDILRLYKPDFSAMEDTRLSKKDEVVAQSHIAQVSKHVGLSSYEDRYHHFILFDDLWANAHRDLASSILRTASRWDPL